MIILKNIKIKIQMNITMIFNIIKIKTKKLNKIKNNKKIYKHNKIFLKMEKMKYKIKI